MTTEQIVPATTGAIALVALLLAVLAWRRAARADARAQAYAARLALLESPVAPAPAAATVGRDQAPHLITRLDDERAVPRTAAPQPATPPRLEGRLFADIVARETVVKAASWTHGLRRALAPETRNRIRFHMRQETKRAARERRAEMKVALREHRARSRAAAADVSAPLGEDVA